MNKRQKKKFMKKSYQKTYWRKMNGVKSFSDYLRVQYSKPLIMKVLSKPNPIIQTMQEDYENIYSNPYTPVII
jgi:hypothetical protein